MPATWDRGESFTPFVARYVGEMVVGTAIATFSISATTFVWLLIATIDSRVLGYSLLSIFVIGVFMSDDAYGYAESGEDSDEDTDKNALLETIQLAIVVVMFNTVVAVGGILGASAAIGWGSVVGVLLTSVYIYWELICIDRDGYPIPFSLLGFSVYVLLGIARVSDTADRVIEYIEFDDFSVSHLPILSTYRVRRR